MTLTFDLSILNFYSTAGVMHLNQWRREEGAKGGMRPGRHLKGQKYGILKKRSICLIAYK